MRASQRQRSSISSTIGSLVDTHYRDRASLVRIRELGQMVSLAAALIHELQRERGLSSGVLAGGGKKFDRDLKAQTVRTDQALTQMLVHWDGVPDSRSSALETAVGDARSHLADLEVLRNDVRERLMTAASAAQQFSALVDRLLVVIAEAPGTSAHPQVTLALISLFNFVLAKEYAGQERALGSAVCAQGNFEPFQFDRFEMLDRQRVEALEVFGQHATKKQRQDWEELSGSQDFLTWNDLRGSLVLAEYDLSRLPKAELWFDGSTAMIDALRGFESHLLTELDHLCLQVLAEARSAWEDSQESPEDAEKDVLRRLERHHLRLQAERQEQRLATRADQAGDVVAGSATVVEEAALWKRRLESLGSVAAALGDLSRRAKVLSLDASIEAVTPAQVARGAEELARALSKVSGELEKGLGALGKGAEQALAAFEGFHSTALNLRRDLLEGDDS